MNEKKSKINKCICENMSYHGSEVISRIQNRCKNDLVTVPVFIFRPSQVNLLILNKYFDIFM